MAYGMSSAAARALAIIANKGGKPLTDVYLIEGAAGKPKVIDVECAKGHTWTPRVGHLVYNDSWCPECYGNAPHKMEDLHAWATELGGKCLSDGAYLGSKSKYTWECGRCAYRWEATWFNVKNRGSWCPECRTSITEHIARSAFQENFPGEMFTKNYDAVGMELDGYSENMRLAFEYDGIQHRKRVEHFQRAEGAFEAQQARDAEKDDRCEDADITLIRIPDTGIVPIPKIRGFVRAKIIELGYDVPANLPDDATFMSTVRATRNADTYVDRVRDMVVKFNGELLSDVCPTRTYPVHVKCRRGHEFDTTFDNLERLRWCPQCADNAAVTAQAIEAEAVPRGYEVLHSETRMSGKRSRRYVTVQCPDRTHAPVEVLWDNFAKGRGCQECGRARAGATRKTTAKEIAGTFKRLGLTIEGGFRNKTADITFVCAEGHRFTSSVKKAEMAGAEMCCPRCVMDRTEDLELLSEFGPESDPVKTELEFRCTACGTFFKTTYRGLRIRKCPCPNKKCPTRHE